MAVSSPSKKEEHRVFRCSRHTTTGREPNTLPRRVEIFLLAVRPMRRAKPRDFTVRRVCSFRDVRQQRPGVIIKQWLRSRSRRATPSGQQEA